MFLLQQYRHQGLRWCATWWRHGEAVDRLRSLWLAWEASRWEGPMAMTVWWGDYCDPTMNALCAAQGTFAQCDADVPRHQQNRPLPSEPAPPGLLTF